MFHINKNAKEWWHKLDICSLCQNGKDDIYHLFEDCNTTRILHKNILGDKSIGNKNLIIDTQDNNIKKERPFHLKGVRN